MRQEFFDDHVHLVIEPSEGGGGLSEIMKGINRAYAQHYTCLLTNRKLLPKILLEYLLVLFSTSS